MDEAQELEAFTAAVTEDPHFVRGPVPTGGVRPMALAIPAWVGVVVGKAVVKVFFTKEGLAALDKAVQWLVKAWQSRRVPLEIYCSDGKTHFKVEITEKRLEQRAKALLAACPKA